MPNTEKNQITLATQYEQQEIESAQELLDMLIAAKNPDRPPEIAEKLNHIIQIQDAITSVHAADYGFLTAYLWPLSMNLEGTSVTRSDLLTTLETSVVNSYVYHEE